MTEKPKRLAPPPLRAPKSEAESAPTPSPPVEPVHQSPTEIGVYLVIEGRVSLPAKAGYAARLNNLITQIKDSIAEEAPWLTDLRVNVERRP